MKAYKIRQYGVVRQCEHIPNPIYIDPEIKTDLILASSTFKIESLPMEKIKASLETSKSFANAGLEILPSSVAKCFSTVVEGGNIALVVNFNYTDRIQNKTPYLRLDKHSLNAGYSFLNPNRYVSVCLAEIGLPYLEKNFYIKSEVKPLLLSFRKNKEELAEIHRKLELFFLNFIDHIFNKVYKD